MSMTPTQARQLGELVARARVKKSLSLRDIEQELGIPRSWLSFLEQGQRLRVSPDRLSRLAGLLDIEPSRIDRITRGAVAEGLPEVRAYFRSKYGLSPGDAAQIADYVERYIEPPEERAA